MANKLSTQKFVNFITTPLNNHAYVFVTLMVVWIPFGHDSFCTKQFDIILLFSSEWQRKWVV
jgi:hypothetical protein